MMRFFITLLMLCISLQSFASNGDTVEFFTNHRFEKCEKKEACFYRKIIKEGILRNVKDYYLDSGSLQMSGAYSDDSLKIQEGFFYWYHTSKQLSQKGAMYTVKK